MASRGPSTNSTRTSCRRPLLRTRPLPPSPPPSPHRGTIVSTTNHFPSATVSVTELQEVLGDYQHIKQQLARLRKQVFMTELKGLAEISALVSENGEEGFKSKRRPQHGVNLVAKTQMKVGKEAEEAMVWMLKAEVEEMNQSLKQREEEHEEEKTHLQAYCIELEDHVATAMEQAELAQAQAQAAQEELEHDRENSRQEIFRLQEQIEELAEALKTHERLTMAHNTEITKLRKGLLEEEAEKEEYKKRLENTKGLDEEMGRLRKALIQTEERVAGMEEGAKHAKEKEMERRRVIREQRKVIENELMLEMERVEQDMAAAAVRNGGGSEAATGISI
ncbi:Hypothetical protein NocV09_01801040 [Nannochloropsis oceanica]